jgi:hypothetical protein
VQQLTGFSTGKWAAAAAAAATRQGQGFRPQRSKCCSPGYSQGQGGGADCLVRSRLLSCVLHSTRASHNSCCCEQPVSLCVERACSAGVPPVGLGSSMRVLIDRRLAAPAAPGTATLPAAATGSNLAPPEPHCSISSPDTAAQPAAAAAAAATLAEAGASAQGTSSPAATSKLISITGSLGVVAAAAPSNPVSGDAAAAMQQPAFGSVDHTSSSRAPGLFGSHPTSSSSTAPQTFVVQCGPQAVLRLSFDLVLQLVAQQATVADVADTPSDNATAVSTLTGIPAGGQAAASAQAGVSLLWLAVVGVPRMTSALLSASGAECAVSASPTSHRPSNHACMLAADLLRPYCLVVCRCCPAAPAVGPVYT